VTDADQLEAESESLSRTANAMGESVAAIAQLEGELRSITQQRDLAAAAQVGSEPSVGAQWELRGMARSVVFLNCASCEAWF
jgi:hypothetical protein